MHLDLDLDVDVEEIPEELVLELLETVRKLDEAEHRGKFHLYFPDTGKLRRDLYPKQLEFFAATKDHLEVLLMAANRVGKTEAGCYAATCWLTGDYPHWWNGRVWKRPVRMWAAGDTNESTRDVIQKKLLGGVKWYGDKKGVDGTGMMPLAAIDQDSITWKSGVPDLIDTVRIKFKHGGFSTLGLKAYAQGRRAFQGTEQDIIWTDEEPPMDVYNEMLIRLMTTKGLAILTFTPLSGWSDVVQSFMPNEAGA